MAARPETCTAVVFYCPMSLFSDNCAIITPKQLNQTEICGAKQAAREQGTIASFCVRAHLKHLQLFFFIKALTDFLKAEKRCVVRAGLHLCKSFYLLSSRVAFVRLSYRWCWD